MATQVSFGPRFEPRSAPVTFWYLVAAGVLNVVLFFGGPAVQGGFAHWLGYNPYDFPARPWTLLTDAVINPLSPFWFLLLGYIMWWVGSDLEQWWGSRVQAGFLVAAAVATGLLLAVSARLAPGEALHGGHGARPLLCALFTVWCLRHPDRQVILLFVPVTGRVLLYLQVAMTWWSYGRFHGLFAVLGSAGLAALYFLHGEQFHRWLGGSRSGRPTQPRPNRRQQRRQARRFQQILEQSGLRLVDDDDEDPSRH